MTEWTADRSREIPWLLAPVLRDDPVTSVVQLGEGTDHLAYEVNWELIVRFVTDPDPGRRASQVRTEAAVLDIAKTLAPPAVPEPIRVEPGAGVMVYRKIDGTPLLHLQAAARDLALAGFGAVMGSFLSRLHQLPMAAYEDFAPWDQVPLAEWLVEAGQAYAQVIDSVPAAHRPAVEAFLAQSPPEEPQIAALCHNDLGVEHVLVESAGVVTGIIDWADAAITDPACDLARIYRDLGAGALAGVLEHYSGPDEPRETLQRRVEFYARCSVFSEIAYGVLPGHDAYRVQSLAALDWLFPT